MSFANLKRNRGKDLDKLTKEVAKLQGGNRETDDRYWQPEVDKVGNGSAVIRFLPAPEGEDVPFVRLFKHEFKGPGGWYIENCKSTINEDDPVMEYNSKLWEGTTDDSDPRRKQVRDQKRKLYYIANIYVVKHTARPEDEGKVFLYRFGKKIFDKLQDKMNPPEDDIKAVNPFDFWEGANFRLRIRKVDGQRNYDLSQFDEVSELLEGDDEKLEEVYGKLYPLKDIIAPDQFKSYDELKARLEKVLDLKNNVRKAAKPEEDKEDETPYDPPKESKANKEPDLPSTSQSDDDDDDNVSFFARLAAEED